MTSFLQKNYRGLYLLLPILLGLSLGHLAATGLGVYLAPPPLPPKDPAAAQPAQVAKPVLQDFETVVQRNIFDSTAAPATLAGGDATQAVAAAPVARPNLALHGTVTRGEASLAVIRSEKEIRTYRLGAEVPGGGRLEDVARNQVQIRWPDGSLSTLTLNEKAAAAAGDRGATAARTAPAAAAGAGGIRAVGENRWVIPREEAERARANINELLRQARMEPRIVEGRTEGFVVRMIQPRSFLALLGIQRGDVLLNVNGVELDSPEKALQIFQQLREARNISIGLQRSGENVTFEYQVD